MEFNELVEFVRGKFAGKDASVVPGKLAVQFNIIGPDGGILYAEVQDGKLSIEPYEYNDRDVEIIMNQENFVKLMNKELNPIAAFSTGKLKVQGDVGKALEITKFI